MTATTSKPECNDRHPDRDRDRRSPRRRVGHGRLLGDGPGRLPDARRGGHRPPGGGSPRRRPAPRPRPRQPQLLMTDTAEITADLSAETGGRTRITAHALERVVAAVAAEELDADRRSVDVTLTDRSGVLDLAVATVLHVVSVERAITEPHAVARSGGTVLERC